MVVEGAVDDVVDQREVLQDLPAAGCVRFHDGVFLVREPPRFLEDGVGNADLADIVHARGSAERLKLCLGQSQLFADHHGIHRDAGGVLACALVLGVDGFGDRHDGLVAHLHLLVGDVEFFLLEFHLLADLSEDEEPGEPDDGQSTYDQHVEPEVGVVVHLLFFHKDIGPLLEDPLLVAVKDGEMEVEFAVRQVRIDDGAHRALRQDGPALLKALEIVADVGILDRVIDDLGIELDAVDAAADFDRRAAAHAVRSAVQHVL